MLAHRHAGARLRVSGDLRDDLLGADGDLAGLPRSSLAVLPATTHVGWAPPYHGIMTRTHLLLPILTEFLDSPREDG